jgi:RND family efflux transporter MFP subunit
MVNDLIHLFGPDRRSNHISANCREGAAIRAARERTSADLEFNEAGTPMQLPLVATCLFGAVQLLSVSGCVESVPGVSPLPPKVSVMYPQQREMADHEEFNGWMGADKTVDVRSRVRGHIIKVNFSDGQYVKKGDLLFELDPRPFEADVGAAEDKVRIYEAQEKAAVADAARYQSLLPQRAASEQETEKAVAAAAAMTAQVAAAKNEVLRARLDLEYSRITADIDGRISKAEMTEGNLVNAGGSDPLLTTIVSVDPIRVYFNVDERSMQRYAKSIGERGGSLADLLANLKDQQAVFEFALDGENEFTHEGTLRFGDNRVDPSTGTVQVYGEAPNDKGMFVPGSRVRVRLTVGKPYAAMLVPDTAILSDQDKRFVLIVDDKNTVRRRNVVLGAITDEGMRVIQPTDKQLEGEDPAQWQVIVDNLQRARLNYPVEVVSPTGGVAAN